jgi:hypothetical protein
MQLSSTSWVFFCERGIIKIMGNLFLILVISLVSSCTAFEDRSHSYRLSHQPMNPSKSLNFFPESSLSTSGSNNFWTFNDAKGMIESSVFDGNSVNWVSRNEWGWATNPNMSANFMPPSAVYDGIVIHNTEFSKDASILDVQNAHIGNW